MAEAAVPHVLLFPFPAQGHVPPMLKLAELLSQADLYVTFLNTEYLHHRFLRNSSALHRLGQRPRFRFRTIPDGLPKDVDPRPSLQPLDLEESMRTRSRDLYRELLAPVYGGQQLDGWPPVTCVVADGLLRLASEVPEEMGIPVMIFRTSSACSVWAFYCIPELIKRGELPFQEEADMDEGIQCVAGMESFLRRRDLPGLMRHVKSTSDRLLQFLNQVSTNLSRGSAVILNTFESAEAPVLSCIRSVCPITFALGPLNVLVRTVGSHGPDDNDSGIAAIPPSSYSANMWQEDRACMTWLDSQPHKSVVYVSFGSIAVVSREELLEFWHGLVNSGKRFLWVARPDLVKGGAGASEMMIPLEVEKGTRERGCLVEWAPQEEVLAHPAVGCFLTHSGWNSTLESMVAGVPMICWPFSGDQQINSRFVSEVWKIGIDMKDTCGRSIVERMVREVMDGEGAVELRRSAGEMAVAARKSAEEGGSSYMDFQRLIQQIRSSSSRTCRH